jgi:endonuclease YncB( thermonuclease family)
MVRFFAILMLIATLVSGAAEPIAPGAIEVIGGDTIRAQGRSVRLVGFDAPDQDCAPNAKANAPWPPRHRSDCVNWSALAD